MLKKEKLQDFWCYDHLGTWRQIKFPPVLSFKDTSDYLQQEGYLLDPDLVVGDEFNFVAMFEHPHKELYLFHLEMDNFAKFIYADSLPAMLDLLGQLNGLLNGHFKTMAIMEGLSDE